MVPENGAASSQIFQPFRALGFVTDDVPFYLQQRGTEYFLTVGIGKAFQVYNCEKISLVCVGPQLPKKIAAVASVDETNYVASANRIVVYERSTQVHELLGHTQPVKFLLPIGSTLLSIGADQRLLVWDVENENVVSEIQFSPNFRPTAVAHPATYLNKVLVGSEEGGMEIWNIRSHQLVYRFASWGSAVTVLQQSNAVDVVAVGLADGRVILHNIRFDETLFTFAHLAEHGPAVSLAFRTDGEPILASGSQNGPILLWHLEKKKLHAVVRDAHRGRVHSLRFLTNEPVLVSAGADNAIKTWLFDQPDGTPRLLRWRSGHSDPPTRVRFYGSNPTLILSAGLDRAFRSFCTTKDEQNCELSQGHIAKKAKKLRTAEVALKLPPVLDFAAAEVRERDWANIVTCHMGHSSAYTWRYETKAIAKHVLPSTSKSNIMSVAVTACGNFAVIGSSAGPIDRYNLQSGSLRTTYTGHTRDVTGVAADPTNMSLVSCSLDGTLRVWDLKGGKEVSLVNISTGLTQLRLSRHSSLVAVAAQDFVLRVVDIAAPAVVRVFAGHTNRVTDLAFSSDGRWLVTSSTDKTVRVWDLPSGRPIDSFAVAKPVTSCDLSPSGDFLATTHVHSTGIYLWANLTHYGDVYLRPLPSQSHPQHLPLPAASGPLPSSTTTTVPHALIAESSSSSSLFSTLDVNTPSKTDAHTQTQSTHRGLVSLSGAGKSRWESLGLIDVIKERNKPKEAPKAPEAAPFFLGMAASLASAKSKASDPSSSTKTQAQREVPSTSAASPALNDRRSTLATLLADASATQSYDPVVAYLSSLGPAQVDSQLRQLDSPPFDPESIEDTHPLVQFLSFVSVHMATLRDFELLQAYLNLFLKIHGTEVSKHRQLRAALAKVQQVQASSWARLDSLLQSTLCLASYLENLTT